MEFSQSTIPNRHKRNGPYRMFSSLRWKAPLRICVDDGKLNAVEIQRSYPAPHMDECMDLHGYTTIYSKLHDGSE